MRNIVCDTCIADQDYKIGTIQTYARTDFEPAEFRRVVIGKAKKPKASQRLMTVSVGIRECERVQLPLDQYNCDLCTKEIRPGERAAAVSAWVDGREVPPWESEYLEI